MLGELYSWKALYEWTLRKLDSAKETVLQSITWYEQGLSSEAVPHDEEAYLKIRHVTPLVHLHIH